MKRPPPPWKAAEAHALYTLDRPSAAVDAVYEVERICAWLMDPHRCPPDYVADAAARSLGQPDVRPAGADGRLGTPRVRRRPHARCAHRPTERRVQSHASAILLVERCREKRTEECGEVRTTHETASVRKSERKSQERVVRGVRQCMQSVCKRERTTCCCRPRSVVVSSAA